MNEKQRKDFNKVLCVIIIGVIAVLMVPLIFHMLG